MYELYELIEDCQNESKEATLKIIEKFTPLIKKYSRKLIYDGAYTDLVIALIETINSFPLFRNNIIKEDKYIVGYISKSIRNKYIYLSKKYTKIYEKEVELNLDIASNEVSTNIMEERVLTKILLDKLPKLQKNIIIQKFMNGYTDAEISNQLNISRQAVNRAKNRGLKNLKSIWKKMYVNN